MKVLLLTNWAGEQLGGGETYLLTLVRNLSDRADFVVGAIGGSAIAQAAAQTGAEVRAIPYGGGPLAASSAIRELVLEQRIDLVHAQGYYPGILARLACRGGIARVVSTMHCVPDVILESGSTPAKRAAVRVRGLVDNLTAGGTCKVIAVSKSVLDGMLEQGFPAEQLVLIDNGIDIEHVRRSTAGTSPFPALASPARWIGCAARLEYSKMTDRLFPALLRLPDDVHLAIAGDGPDRQRLEALAAEQGLVDRVHFLGHLSATAPFLSAIEVFVLPTPLGGKNLTVLEAMALARPVVATPGGAGEAVTDGVEGLLVDSADAAAFATAIERVLNEPTLASRLGEAGVQRVERDFDSRKSLESTYAVYQECMTDRKGQ